MSLVELHEALTNEIKKVLKTGISTNPATLERYKWQIIEAHNAYIIKARSLWNLCSAESKLVLLGQIRAIKLRTLECFVRLAVELRPAKSALDLLFFAEQPLVTPDLVENLENLNNLFKMAEPPSNAEFLRMAAATINKNYAGDPLALQSFIDSITLLQGLATTGGLQTFLVQFVKTKMEGKARECVTDEHNTVNLIIERLRGQIKPDSSRVVEGRMLALRLNGQPEDFATKAESLAESFRRSLVIEGMTSAKANEMAIDKTVELCRLNVTSELVKSVLESTKFDQPKEVIAKMITQQDKSKKEHQVLAYRALNRNENKNNGHRGQNKKFNNYYNNGNGYSNNGYNGSHNNNNNGNRRGGRGKYRGRGGGRGNYHNNQNGYQNGNRDGNQGGYRGDNRNIRAFGSENDPSPQQHLLGESSQGQQGQGNRQ